MPNSDKFPNKPNEIVDNDLINWMTNLPPLLQSIPIIHLAIPGSHDSVTYTITRRSRLAPDAETILVKLNRFLGPIPRLLMSRWSVTQKLDLTEQLNCGIRYYDFRLATKLNTNKIFICHGLYGSEVTEPLKEIKTFLATYPREVCIVDFQHFYAFELADHTNFKALLTGLFAHKMLPYSDHMDHLTLDYLTKQFQYQIIVIYRNQAGDDGTGMFWPSRCFPSPWPNTVNLQRMFSYLESSLENRNPNVGNISQCILTPTTGFVIKHLFSTLKKKCALRAYEPIINWLEQQKPTPQGVNIIISDFVDLGANEFSKKVINLNFKLLEIKP